MSTTGVMGEDRQDFTKRENKAIRVRSIALLRVLIRPHRVRFGWTAIMIIASTAAQVAGPLLIAWGIDIGLPEAVDDGNFAPILTIVVAFLTIRIQLDIKF